MKKLLGLLLLAALPVPIFGMKTCSEHARTELNKFANRSGNGPLSCCCVGVGCVAGAYYYANPYVAAALKAAGVGVAIPETLACPVTCCACTAGTCLLFGCYECCKQQKKRQASRLQVPPVIRMNVSHAKHE